MAAVLLPAVMVSAQKNFIAKVGAFMDSATVKGTDPRYIEIPKKGWAVMYNTMFEQQRLTISAHNHIVDNSPEMYTEWSFDSYTKIMPKVATSMGLWAGYRGYGFGYAVSLSGNDGMNLALNMVTPSYGLNVKFSRYHFDKPYLSVSNMHVIVDDHDPDPKKRIPHVDADIPDYTQEFELENAMKITTLMVDGFWIFNKRKFSYSAAYDQSAKQIRSAGSLIAGLMFYFQKYDLKFDHTQTVVDANDDKLALLVFGKDVNDFKIYQGSIGCGYTYNWVPARNLLINVTAMPVLTVVNKLVARQYEEKLNMNADRVAITLEDKGTVTNNGNVRLNFDAMMSAVYWYKDWFFKATGQLHQARANYNLVTVNYFDWSAKVSIGRSF
jgi:hypothetical protein